MAPTNCLLCNAPLKNGICPSCGWNPDAPDLGKSEAELAQEQETRRLRALLGQDSTSAKNTSTTNTADQGAGPDDSAPASDSDATLIGYLNGLGYTDDAAHAIIQKHRDSVVASLNKAKGAAAAGDHSPQLPAVALPDTQRW